MIRLVNVIKRREDLGFSEFNDYLLNEHGKLVLSHSEALGLRRYVQLHNLEEPSGPTVDHLRGEMLTPYDGVQEFWFDDMTALLKAEALTDIDTALKASELKFMNHGQSAAWIAYEVPHINPTPEDIIAAPESSVVRLFYALNAPHGMTINEAQFYWRVQHGPLVRRAGPDIQTLRYLQVHALEHEFNERYRSARNLADPFYGHAELWFDLSNSPADGAKDAGHMLYVDETRFIDFSRSAIWYGKEHVLLKR